MVKEIRKINISILVLIGFLIPINQIVGNFLLKNQFFSPISKATNYWIQPTLVVNIISLAVFSFIIFGIGKHNLESIWLTKQKVKKAAFFVFFIWFSSQIVTVIATYLNDGNLTLVNKLNVLTGNLLGQLFGNAAFEELIYRGVFFLQFYLLLKRKMADKKALLIAIISSQVVFAVIHIPNRLLVNQVENLGLNLLGLFGAGVVLTLIYFRTKNLAFLVGVHALINQPFNVIETSFPMRMIIFILIILVTLLWKNKAALNVLSK